MKLTSVGIGNYRSIGEEPVTINLEKKINVLIGANNSGKSSVMKAMLWLKTSIKNNSWKFQKTEWHQRDQKLSLILSIHISIEDECFWNHIPDTGEMKFCVTEGNLTYINGFFDSLPYSLYMQWYEKTFKRSFSGPLSEEQLKKVKGDSAVKEAHKILKNFPDVKMVPQFRFGSKSNMQPRYRTPSVEGHYRHQDRSSVCFRFSYFILPPFKC